MINLENTTIEGFGSILKPITYKLNRPGLNIIMGRNGSGKTTILNALTWCLFGRLIKRKKSINPWPHIIGSSEYKGTKVTTRYYKLGILREITHCSEYKGKINGVVGKNRLIICVDGVEQDKVRDKNDGWKWIVEDLGYSFELFKSSIIFGQKVKRIMEEEVANRNKVLEEAFEVSYISQAKIKIDQRLRDNKPNLVTLGSKIDNVLSIVKSLKLTLKSINQQKEEFYQNQRKTVFSYEEIIQQNKIKQGVIIRVRDRRIKKISHNIERSQRLLGKGEQDELKGIKDKEFKITLTICNKETTYETNNQQIKKLIEQYLHVERTCSKCGNPISINEVTKQKKNLKEELSLLKGENKELKKSIDKLKEKHAGYIESIASLEKKVIKIKKTELKIKRLEGKLNDAHNLKYDIDQCTSTIKTYGKLIIDEKAKEPSNRGTKQLKKEVSERKLELQGLKDQYNELKEKITIDEWLIKDPLSNSGIKAYIFENMLRTTNHELAQYESLLDYRIELGINLDSKRRDFSLTVFQGDNEIPHEDLSGGQMQLGDLCIALAIHETVNDTKGCNILMLDEVFESLDDINIEKVGEILALKARKKSIHIITHHKEFSPSNSYFTGVHLNKKKHSIIEQAAA